MANVVCQFYLEGKCRYGDACRNHHVDPDESGERIQSNGESHVSRGAKSNVKRGGRSRYTNGMYGYNRGDQQRHPETAIDYYSRLEQQSKDQRRNNGPYSPASRHMRDQYERRARDDYDLNNSLSKMTIEKRNYNNNNRGYVDDNEDLDDCRSSVSYESVCSYSNDSDDSASKLSKRRRRRRSSSASSELELKEGEQVVTTHNNNVRLLVKSGDNSQDSSSPNENPAICAALKEKAQPNEEVNHWPAREYDWIELNCRMLVVKIKQLSSEKEMRQYTTQINSILDKRLNGTYHGNGFNGYSGRPLATRNMGPRKYAKMGKRNGQSNGPL